ncbi:MAG: saccharopine dehydrogenase NADP-binding domain-containing protein [Asticcacaulis sp.]
MRDAVLILGGYGNFGKRIAAGLRARGVPVVIAGRDAAKARACAENLGAGYAVLDIATGLEAALADLRPRVVIHTAGPFQGADYGVAEVCLRAGVHYVDLSDGRDFVTGFTRLDAEAKVAGVTAISGASSVPCLSSAVIEAAKGDFVRLDRLDFGICPGQGAERGLATTAGILSYVGKPLKAFAGHAKPYGWQDLRQHDFPHLGRRFMGNCDIPDLDLLPERYGFQSVRFGAGLEVGFIHLGLWLMSWAVRWGMMSVALPRLAGPMLRMADLFNGLGSDDGGMFVCIEGTGADGKPLTRNWHIIAREGDGPQIPCVPAILLGQRLYEGDSSLPAGAYSSVGRVTLEDYVAALEGFAIEAGFSAQGLPNGRKG